MKKNHVLITLFVSICISLCGCQKDIEDRKIVLPSTENISEESTETISVNLETTAETENPPIVETFDEMGIEKTFTEATTSPTKPHPIVARPVETTPVIPETSLPQATVAPMPEVEETQSPYMTDLG